MRGRSGARVRRAQRINRLHVPVASEEYLYVSGYSNVGREWRVPRHETKALSSHLRIGGMVARRTCREPVLGKSHGNHAILMPPLGAKAAAAYSWALSLLFRETCMRGTYGATQRDLAVVPIAV